MGICWVLSPLLAFVAPDPVQRSRTGLPVCIMGFALRVRPSDSLHTHGIQYGKMIFEPYPAFQMLVARGDAIVGSAPWSLLIL